MKSLFKVLFVLLMVGIMTACDNEQHIKRVGIIIPMEHQALNEIIIGFERTLTKTYAGAIKFKVANAQGDINLQRAIIAQLRDAHYDLIVPIATGTAQMTISMVKQQPIVALAAEISAHDRSLNTAIVDDEIDKKQILDFIHAVDPTIKKITLVHSAADKIFTEVAQLKQAAAATGITLQEFLVQNLSDLYSATTAIAPDTQAIFILKDNLIASGIDTLIQLVNSRKIPLITSDDGTVQHGASFALGVHERQIGAEGGKLAAKILQGAVAGKLPIVKMTQPTVFVNSGVLAKQGISAAQVIQAAKKLHYTLEDLATTKNSRGVK